MYFSKNWPDIFNDPLTRNPVIWGLYAIGVLLATTAPDNIFDILPFLDVISRTMAKVIPSINKWADYSSFPDRARLFFTYSWLMVPLQAAVVTAHKPSEQRFLNIWQFGKAKGLRTLLLFAIVTAWLYFAGNFAIKDTPPCRVCVNNSALWFALIGGLITLVAAFLIAALAWWIKNFKRIYRI
jgi:hypothetical protein